MGKKCLKVAQISKHNLVESSFILVEAFLLSVVNSLAFLYKLFSLAPHIFERKWAVFLVCVITEFLNLTNYYKNLDLFFSPFLILVFQSVPHIISWSASMKVRDYKILVIDKTNKETVGCWVAVLIVVINTKGFTEKKSKYIKACEWWNVLYIDTYRTKLTVSNHIAYIEAGVLQIQTRVAIGWKQIRGF